MTEEIVQPEDIEIPEPEQIENTESDDELNPEGDPLPLENETAEQLKVRLAASEEARQKLFARLQREKNKGKPTPPAQVTPPATPPAQPASLTREEAIVIAKGHSEEELEQAKKVAFLEECTVVQALDKDLFKDWKTRRDAEAKRQEAQLGASRGGKVTKKTTFDSKDLSDDDHKALFEAEMKK